MTGKPGCSTNGRFNGIRIIEIINLFYKRMIQLNIEKACFDQAFFKTRFF